MSPLLSLCVLFLSFSEASRSHDFTLCNTLAQWSDVISTPSKYMSKKKSLTYLHSMPCFNLCFNRKLLPVPRSRSTFKLALILMLAGDVSLNHGPLIRHHISLATPNIRSIQEKTASLTDLIISKTIDILAVTETWLRPHDTAAWIFPLLVIPSTVDHVQ